MSAKSLPSGKVTLTAELLKEIEGFTKTLGVLVLGYSGIGWINILRWYGNYSGCKNALNDSINGVCDIRFEEMALMGLEALLMTIIGLYLLNFSVKRQMKVAKSHQSKKETRAKLRRCKHFSEDGKKVQCINFHSNERYCDDHGG